MLTLRVGGVAGTSPLGAAGGRVFAQAMGTPVAYAEPAYHVRRNRRNGQDPARLGALRAARVTAAAADVSPDLLELLAFGPGPDHNLQNALLDGGPKARLHPTES